MTFVAFGRQILRTEERDILCVDQIPRNVLWTRIFAE